MLPDVIFQMTMLRKLDLNFIRMTNLPGEIGQLANLEVRLPPINPSPHARQGPGCRQKRSPFSHSLHCIALLLEQILQLRETMIKVLPREITNLRKLTDLDLSLNNMTTGTHHTHLVVFILGTAGHD